MIKKRNLLWGLETLRRSLVLRKDNRKKLTAFLQKIQDRRFVLGSITGEELRQKFDAIAHVICGADHDLLKLIERNVFGGDERKRNFPKG